MLEEVPIPDDGIHELVMQKIEEHNLPPLNGKRNHQNGATPSSNNQPKRQHIKYDYARVEASVISDWAGDVPCFPNKQFECTFRI